MKQRYTAYDFNHKQADMCSKLRKLLSKPNTLKNRQKADKLRKRLGIA